ncbi:threonine/serine exporter family protein [Dubosiella newyorkensis]|uniref:Threonine/serine exporter-like N-terminal domain-containing protein n=4 Tax=Dubosiella newyorkensis TaxID=1862672 RepID=A0A1U7NL35_9FIRM|nr:threonine/serine exporter family protein [Dubosiella newyorkensis]OLU45309.1 hypothetical protein BO225_09215 [Dubosiella newyorkensis]
MIHLEPYETNQLAKIVMRCGKLLLMSGGDIISTQESMKRVCLSRKGTSKPECVLTPTTMIFSFKTKDQIVTRACEITKVSNDLVRIARIHDFVNHCEAMNMEQMESALDSIEQETTHPRWIRILASGFCSAGFGLFFGDPIDLPFIFLIGLGAGWILTNQGNRILLIIAASFFVTVCPILLEHLVHIQLSIETTVVSNMPLMVPGMVIFNAIRDTLAGKYQAGLNRTAEACLIAAAIATGTGLALGALVL